MAIPEKTAELSQIAARTNGLPLGVQLIARRGEDAMLLGLAYTLEQRLGDVVYV